MRRLYHFLLTIPIVSLWLGCARNVQAPRPLNPSTTGQLTRYDLSKADYDVSPVTTFVYSYGPDNRITNVFEKNGQVLTSFALSYNGSQLSKVTDNTLGTQSFYYDTGGRLSSIFFTTVTDTGKRVFTYDNTGLLLAVLDSVKRPDKLPSFTQYLFTYDNGSHNVIRITQNQLDLQGRPTLVQYSFYSFDDKPNPFAVGPWLRDATLLPGSIAALVNRNNIVQTRLVGTIFHTSGGSSIPTLDTISNYISTRQYQYDPKGLPLSCRETFLNLQYNYSGTRNFSYDY